MDDYEIGQQLIESQYELDEKRILLEELEEEIDALEPDGDPEERLKLEEERDDLLSRIEELEEEIGSLENLVSS